jgi:hypothetical protein
MHSGIVDAKLLLSLTQKRQQFCLLLVLGDMQEFFIPSTLLKKHIDMT